MFTKTLMAGVLATSLALTSLSPTTASAAMSDEDAIAGILTLLLLGAAIHNRRDRDPAPAPQPDVTDNWRVLPANCIRDVTRRNGNTIRMFGQRCLNNNYNHVNRLPDQCHVRVRNQNNQVRQGYRVRCLRREGFRTNRH